MGKQSEQTSLGHLRLVHTKEGQLTGPIEQVGKADEGVGHVQVEQQHGRQEGHALHLRKRGRCSRPGRRPLPGNSRSPRRAGTPRRRPAGSAGRRSRGPTETRIQRSRALRTSGIDAHICAFMGGPIGPSSLGTFNIHKETEKHHLQGLHLLFFCLSFILT